jgi:hypothetical protein
MPLHVGSFELSVPRDWVEIPLRATDRTSRIADLVLDRIGDAPDLAALRRSAEAMLRTTASDASQAGGVFLACYAQLVDQEPSLLLASVIVSLHGLATTPAAAALASVMSATQPDLVVTTERLSAGEAVRAQRSIELQPEDWPAPLVFRQVQYLVPVGPEGILCVTFSTPGSRWADRFTELFAQIAGTLVIHREAPVQV